MNDLTVTVTVNGALAEVALGEIVKEAMKQAARRSAFILEEEFRKGLNVAEMMRAHRKALEEHHMAAFFQMCSDDQWARAAAELKEERLRAEIRELRSKLLTYEVQG